MWDVLLFPRATSQGQVSLTLTTAAGANAPLRCKIYLNVRNCLLYTSDAADECVRVDLGGRRIIKKIFFKQKTAYEIVTRLVGSEMCIRDRYYPKGASGKLPVIVSIHGGGYVYGTKEVYYHYGTYLSLIHI